jgi:peptide/nickel transport system substrate-binding protein
MTRFTTGGKAAAAGLIIALTAAACGGGDDPKTGASNTPDEVPQGGTLKLLSTADFEHLDPQRAYVSNALNAGRLIYRTLTTFKSASGATGNEIVGDLAKDTGEPSDGGKTWKFVLRDGLKYEDGSEIVAADIKYGVERSFSKLLPEGPQYAKQYLEGGDKYTGPYEDPKGLASIEVPDPKTIIFKLKQPVGDFNYTVTLPTFSPVPKAKDTKTQYDNKPFSSGPYKIETYQRQKSLTLVRNTFWSKDTDEVRKAGPDRIEFTFGLDPAQIDQRLINDSDPNAAYIDAGGIQGASVASAIKPTVDSRRVEGSTQALRYIALDINSEPFKNPKVREAIQYAVNRETLQTARGGTRAGGELIYQTLIPGLPGRKEFKAFDVPPTGDPEKAKQILKDAGVSNLTFQLYSTSAGKGKAVAEAFQAAMARADIKVNLKLVDASVYYTEIGKSGKQNGAVVAGWGPDWPNASTVIPPLFDGRQIKTEGNQNFCELNDPAINSRMDDALKETDLGKQGEIWAELDETISKTGCIIPFTVDKAIFVAGSKVKNLFIHPFYGEPDAVALAVGS